MSEDTTPGDMSRVEHVPHILIVDDDTRLRRSLSAFLGQQGLRVTMASDGREMWEKLSGARVELIVLDVMMPGEDGLSVLRALRRDTGIPVIMLTAVAGETDRIVGLELGAEDYVCKPFSPRELLARIRVVLRRNEGHAEARSRDRPRAYHFQEWTLDVRARTLTSPSGSYVEMTTGEFEMLQAFVEHPNRILNRDQLLDLARGRASMAVDRAIDVQIMRLRRKIEANPQVPVLIKTVRNGGYIFTPDVHPMPS